MRSTLRLQVKQSDIVRFHERDAAYWDERGKRMVMRLFRYAAATVPAYRKFLRQHDVDPRKIRSVEDLKNLPFLDKKLYLKNFKYTDLFPGGAITKATTISATSGSTGDAFYFPRGEDQDTQYEYLAECFLKNQFEIHKYRTLGVIGFGLGIWIGGIFTYKIFNRIAAKGYDFCLVPVGPSKEHYLRAIKKFGEMYDQIIIIGYPPFIKDVIDEASHYGIQWNKYRMRILTAAEGFSEKFREYVSKKAGLKNMFRDFINIYGSVELGTMAHETEIANIIRNHAVKNKKLFKAIFGQATRIPTLAQYHPGLTYFEENNGEVYGYGYGSSIPLVRYRLYDSGGVIPFLKMQRICKEYGFDIEKEGTSEVGRLPFVYVYERSDFVALLYGIQIYPEFVRHGLLDHSLQKAVTGKFTMITKTDNRFNQYLEINVELQKKSEPTQKISKIIVERILQSLRSRSSEFKELTNNINSKKILRIVLWGYEHPTYFETGAKQIWSMKS